jgi:hypothetical protein
MLLNGAGAPYRDHRHVIEGMLPLKNPIDDTARRIAGRSLRLCSHRGREGRLSGEDVPRRFDKPVGIQDE